MTIASGYCLPKRLGQHDTIRPVVDASDITVGDS